MDIDQQIYILELCPGKEVITSPRGNVGDILADLDLVFCPRRESWQGKGKRNGLSVGMIQCRIMPFLLGALSKGCMQDGDRGNEHARVSHVEEKDRGPSVL